MFPKQINEIEGHFKISWIYVLVYLQIRCKYTGLIDKSEGLIDKSKGLIDKSKPS